jgi:hypothetical protein
MSQPKQQSATIPQPGPPIAHRKRAREQKSVEPAVFTIVYHAEVL